MSEPVRLTVWVQGRVADVVERWGEPCADSDGFIER